VFRRVQHLLWDGSEWTPDEPPASPRPLGQLDDDDYSLYLRHTSVAASGGILGLFAGEGVPTPTLEDFQAARQEAWVDFPREFPDPAR
jgi:hypothetical protein